MTTEATLVLSPPANLRDLAGMAIDGGVLQPGLAIRSDDLSTITEEDAEPLVAGGLTSVIDLRTPAEVAATGRGVLADRPVAYHHLPLMNSIGQSASPRTPGIGMNHHEMGEMYLRMVESAAPQLATALSIIALSPGTTAFHCAGGRDRTGVVAAMLLLALGASDEDIVADYTVTGSNQVGIMERTAPVMEGLLASLGMDLKAMTRALSEGDPSDMRVSMEFLLAQLRDRYGDPLRPLRDAGLGNDTILRLRARALLS